MNKPLTPRPSTFPHSSLALTEPTGHHGQVRQPAAGVTANRVAVLPCILGIDPCALHSLFPTTQTLFDDNTLDLADQQPGRGSAREQ